jgi:intracellular sulfur oxidation DsrE/DsrF family protein
MRILLVILALLAVSLPGMLQAGDAYRAVFELTSDNPKQWTAVLNNVENLRKALPGTSVEVVAHGPGLQLLMREHNSEVAARMEDLAKQGVVFAACQNTMKRMNVSPDQLSPFAQTVDSGVAEIVRKQQAGWAYLRSGG